MYCSISSAGAGGPSYAIRNNSKQFTYGIDYVYRFSGLQGYEKGSFTLKYSQSLPAIADAV